VSNARLATGYGIVSRTMASDPGHFEPIHSAHAIEQVLFSLQFDKPIDEVNLSAAAEAIHAEFKEELPGRAVLQTMAFSFGPLGLGQGGALPIGGTAFNLTRKDGTVESELRIERNTIVFRTAVYTRWDEIWGRARRYFNAAIPHYVATDVGVGATSLNFQDRFYWVGDLALCRANRLLRQGSGYVCPNVYEAKDLWHSHMGAFTKGDEGTKRLINVNIDCLDEPGKQPPRRVIAITTAITDQLNQPGYISPTVKSGDVAPYFARQMTALHDLSKSTFRNVVNDDMCKRIALDG
jgi:uncharacterized protein (TIGR04255 family)